MTPGIRPPQLGRRTYLKALGVLGLAGVTGISTQSSISAHGAASARLDPIFPPDPRYAALVRGFNQRFEGNPVYIQLCNNPQQVLQALQSAVNAHLRVTVRSGGHCYEDFVTNNNQGVLIDLSPLNAVYRKNGLFCVEGGCTLWNVYTRLYKEYGVTIPAGSCYSVGVGGHIAGGGYGLLSRKYGLTVDYLDAIELVYVNKAGQAQLITVRADALDPAERDLFWSHQGGGGGNFGIVTKYWFKALPVAPPVAYLTNIAWNWYELNQDQFRQLIINYGAFFAQHSDIDSPYKDLFTLLRLTHKAGQQITLTMQYVGDHPELVDQFVRAIAPEGVRYVFQPTSQDPHQLPQTPGTRKLSWLEATQILNGAGPNQRGKYKSAYMLRPFSARQIDVMWKFLTDSSYANSQALLMVDSYGCQVNAVSPTATAVSQRSAIMKLQYITQWVMPEEDSTHLQWIRNFYTAMYGATGPYPDENVDGCYVNYPDTDLLNWQHLYHKDNYARLQRTKARWDPLNIFHHAQSIELPSS